MTATIATTGPSARDTNAADQERWSTMNPNTNGATIPATMPPKMIIDEAAPTTDEGRLRSGSAKHGMKAKEAAADPRVTRTTNKAVRRLALERAIPRSSWRYDGTHDDIPQITKSYPKNIKAKSHIARERSTVRMLSQEESGPWSISAGSKHPTPADQREKSCRNNDGEKRTDGVGTVHPSCGSGTLLRDAPLGNELYCSCRKHALRETEEKANNQKRPERPGKGSEAGEDTPRHQPDQSHPDCAVSIGEQSTRQLGQRVCNEERGDDQSTLGVVEIELLTEQGESEVDRQPIYVVDRVRDEQQRDRDFGGAKHWASKW
eukprot:gene22771-27317_t